ncbi:MAG: CotH kinase family protein, partial [Bacteroidales bacterium]|nr:CotH kinase family protein [Bacteroidales bacterium]
QRQYIIQHYNAFEQSILNYNNSQAAYENICRYLDTTAFVNWYIANELTANPDGIWSIYIKKHRDDDRFYFGPLWDNDISFGNCNRIYSLSNDGRSESIMLKCFSNNRVKELINKVLTIPPIRKMIAERWKVIYQTGLLKEDLIHLLYNMEEELDASQKLNYQKWSTALSSRIYNEIYYGASISFAMQFEYLRNYLSDRIDFLDGFFTAMGNDDTIDPEDPPLPPVDTMEYFSPEPYVWYHLQCQLNNKYLICEEVAGGYQLGYTYNPETAGDWAKFEISCSKDKQNRSIYHIRNKASKAYVYINAAQAKIPLDPIQKTAFTLYPSPNEDEHYGFMVLSDNSSLNELGIDANGGVVSWSTKNKSGQREYQFIPDRAYFQSIFNPADPQQPLWAMEENWDKNIPNAYATAIIAKGAKLELSQDETVVVDSLIILPGAEVLNYGTIQADVTLFCANDSLSASYDYSQDALLISERMLYRSFDRSQSWYALSLPLDIKSIRNEQMAILDPGEDYSLMKYSADSNRFDTLSLLSSLRPKAGPYLFSVSPEREQQAFLFVFDTKSSYQPAVSDMNFSGNTGFRTIQIPAAGTYILKDHLHFVLQDDQQQLSLPAFNAYFATTGDELPDSLSIYNMNPPDDTLALEIISGGVPVLLSRKGLLIIYDTEPGEDFALFNIDGRLVFKDKALNNPTYVSLKQGLYLFRYKERFQKIQIP